MATVATRVDLFAAGTDVMTVLGVLRLFTSGRHSWIIELDEVRAVEEYISTNAPIMTDALGGLARKAWISRTAWTSSSANAAQSIQYEVTATTIEIVLADLERPGILVVEDLVSDRIFLDAIVSVYGKGGVATALKKGWLEVRHAGGGGRMLAVARDEASKFLLTPRVGALLDSDSLYPGHQTSAHVKQSRIIELGLSCIVLTYREIENYIPNRALATLRPYSKFGNCLGALKALTDKQRSYLDMKKGLCRRSVKYAKMPQEHQDLYGDVPNNVLIHLEEGFGDGVIECLSAAVKGLTPSDFEALGPEGGKDIARLLELLRSLI